MKYKYPPPYTWQYVFFLVLELLQMTLTKITMMKLVTGILILGNFIYHVLRLIVWNNSLHCQIEIFLGDIIQATVSTWLAPSIVLEQSVSQ